MKIFLAIFFSFSAQAEVVTGILKGKQELTLKAQSQGVLTQVLIEEGQNVKKGDVIAIIDDEQERIERDLATAEFESAEKDFKSTKKLRKFLSREEFLKKKDLYLRKKSNRELKDYNFESTRIRAPFDGIVANQFFKKGEMISVGDAVSTVLKRDQLTMEIFVPAGDIHSFKLNKSHAFKVDSTEQEHMATTVFVGPVIDSASGTVKVRLDVDNSDNQIVPGSLALIETSASSEASIREPASQEK